MPTEFYPPEKGLRDLMREVLMEHHTDLLLVIDNIAIMMRDTAAKRNGIEVPFAVSKAPPMWNGLAEVQTNYEFLIIFPADLWRDWNSMKRTAVMDSALCACLAEESPDDGTIKTSKRHPDLWGYHDAVRRHGTKALFKGYDEHEDGPVDEAAQAVLADVVDADDPAATLDAPILKAADDDEGAEGGALAVFGDEEATAAASA